MNQLHRSSRNKMVGGVAAGLAEYLDVDATLVRVVWALAFFAGGIGFIAYLVCWIVFPEDTSLKESAPDGSEKEDVLHHRALRRRNMGLLLIGIGLVFLIQNIMPIFWDKGWPLLLVIAGLYILFGNRKGDQL